MKQFTYITNSITFIILFSLGAYSVQRYKRLIQTLDVCAQYTLLPQTVTIRMSDAKTVYTNRRVAARGFARADDNLIEIAKLSLSDSGTVVAHELGHLEHYMLFPESTRNDGWSAGDKENYAVTLQQYFQYAEMTGYSQRGYSVSPYIKFNEKREISRSNARQRRSA